MLDAVAPPATGTWMGEERESLRRDGYFLARGILPEADVAAVVDSVHRTICDQLQAAGAHGEADLHAALRSLFAADLDRYQRVVAALWRKADVSGLMRHPALFAFLREALGFSDIFLPGGEVAVLMAEDLKIPGGYFGFAPHQDFPSVQGSLDGVVAWIPLNDIDLDGWPLEVAPGSHRRGLITDVQESRNGWEVQPSQLRGLEWRPIEASIGDVIFISMFTLHRSRREGDPARMRLALSTRFDNGAEPTFIDRAYPTAYQRTVHRDQYVEGFPTEQQIKSLFG